MTPVDLALNSITEYAHEDLRSFCAVYLGHYFMVTTEEEQAHPEWKIKPGWGQPQRAMADALTSFTNRTGHYAKYSTLILEVFRGAGKSTIGFVGYVLWLACTGRRKFILAISDTKTQAVDQLASVLNELETNEDLQKTYGQLYDEKRTGSKTERKRQDDVTLANGVRIVARGGGQKLRGMRWKSQRPDCVVLDDPQGEDQAESPEQAEKLNRWVDRVVIPMGAPNMLMVVIATPIRYNDIIAHTRKKAASLHLRYPAISSTGEIADPNRFPKARLDWLMEEMGPTAFDQEMKLVPAGEDVKPFQLAWMLSWPEQPALEAPGFIGWDPSSKLKEMNDYTSITVGKAVEDRLTVIRCATARLPLRQQVEAVVMLAKKYNCKVICLETIAAQEWAKQDLIDELNKQQYNAVILGQEHNVDKRIFLETTLQAPIFNGTIRWYKPQGVPAYEKEMVLQQDQLSEFPLSDHDDRCDSLADCYLAFLHYRRAFGVAQKQALLEKYVASVANTGSAKIRQALH
jgi:phage terminase large subunit-like protein